MQHILIATKFSSATFTFVSCTSVVDHWNIAGTSAAAVGTASSTSPEETPPSIPERLLIDWNKEKQPKGSHGSGKYLIEKTLGALTMPPEKRSELEFRVARVGPLTASTSSGIWTLRRSVDGGVEHTWPLMFDVGLWVMGGRMPDPAAAGLVRLDWLSVDIAARAIIDVALAERLGKQKGWNWQKRAAHVMNCQEEGTTWADVQSWLVEGEKDGDQNEEDVLEGKEVEIVPVGQWLNQLTDLEREHPAKECVEMWKEDWKPKPTNNLIFQTKHTERSSFVFRHGKKHMNMTKERFWKMLKWILKEGKATEDVINGDK